MLNRPKPIADQVKELLRERILRQEYDAADRLPSEAQLASDFEVSRATVRTALAALAAEGLITRKQGDGTYINQRVLEVNTRLDSIWEFTKLIEASGRQPSIKILSEVERIATPSEATALGLDKNDEVLIWKRLFFADERPIILSENMVPKWMVRKPYEQGALAGSILGFLQEYCNQEFSYAIADISAVAVTQEMHTVLKIAVGTPLLRLEEVFFNTDDQPLVYAINYHDDKAFRFRVVRSFS